MRRYEDRKHQVSFAALFNNEKRQTTINHAFASAIAPSNIYDMRVLKEAIALLGQDPEKDLFCVYCNESAETWDHVFGLVKDLKFSGYGHVIGNLLPCCKKCNSEKGNKDWEAFIKTKNRDNSIAKVNMLKQYFEKYLPKKVGYEEIKNICPAEMHQLNLIRDKIMELFKEADAIAEKVRTKINSH